MLRRGVAVLLVCLVALAYARNYYEILGVAQSASEAEIKARFKKLAVKTHPDKSTDANAADKFSEVREAYETLVNPEKRAEYDNQLRNPYRQQRQNNPFQSPWQTRPYDPDADTNILMVSKVRFQAVIEKMGKMVDKPSLWALKVYSRYCSQCSGLQKAWVSFCSRVSPAVSCGRVLREEDQELIKYLNIGFSPQFEVTLVLIDSGSVVLKKNLRPGTTAEQMMGFAQDHLLGKIDNLQKNAELSQFLKKSPHLPHLIFYNSFLPEDQLRFFGKKFKSDLVISSIASYKLSKDLREALMSTVSPMEGSSVILAFDNSFRILLDRSHQAKTFESMDEKLQRFRSTFYVKFSDDLFVRRCKDKEFAICVLTLKDRDGLTAFEFDLWKKFHSSLSGPSDVHFFSINPRKQASFLAQFDLNASRILAIRSGLQSYSIFRNGFLSSAADVEDCVSWIESFQSGNEQGTRYTFPMKAPHEENPDYDFSSSFEFFTSELSLEGGTMILLTVMFMVFWTFLVHRGSA